MADGSGHDEEPVRIGHVEMLGAWLHVWTPAKGATVPPVPKRKLAIGGAAAALLLAALAAWIVPRIDESKRATARAERRRAVVLTANERTRLAADQQLHQGGAPGLAEKGGTGASGLLVAALERSITLDARQRVAAGTLKGPILQTSCHPYTRTGAAPRSAPDKYECTAVTAEIQPSVRNVAGQSGYPFWARVNFSASSYVWCKINPRPSERAIGSELVAVALPAQCDLQRGLN
ncbi:MAG: hypothetical protein QOK04_1066 [Solirubrobacteraceae bacterium]|jgi:hypothetical protein|nr:hypothetical protein [Solirubrobacteraceae bacterium]